MPTPSTGRKNSFAFTLVELVLVTVMLAFISLTVFASFNNAVRLMAKVRQDIPEEDIDIMMERFTVDVKNIVAFTGLEFKGSEESVELAALVQSPRLGLRSVGKVRYAYDAEAGVLDRELLDFSHLFTREQGYLTHPLSHLRSLKFLYGSFDPVKKEYQWEREWLKKELPSAIRLEFEVGDGTASTLYTKTVTVPCGA